MPTRDELHKLVDSMPEGAMEAAHRLLSRLQVWPPPPPPDHDRPISLTDVQTVAGTRAGFSSWDGDTYVVKTHRGLRGHELIIVERLRMDGKRLIYRHEINGPGGKHEEREVTFRIG